MDEETPLHTEPKTLLIRYIAADLTEAARIYQGTTSLHIVIQLSAIVGLLVVGWGLALFALDMLILPNLFEGQYRLGLAQPSALYLRWILVALVPLSILSWFRPFRPLAVWLDFQLNKTQYRTPYHVTIDAEGVSVKTSTAEARQFWPAFSKVIESGNLFVLVYGKWQYAVLPKRSFTSPEAIEEFRTALQEHTGTYQVA